MEVLYSCGIRRAEVIHLKLYDLDPERGTLVIRQGKGKKDRFVPIGERAIAWMQKYIREARPQLRGRAGLTARCFCQARAKRSAPTISRSRCVTMCRTRSIGKTGACHLFRHTMATLMLEGGADIRYIQQMLGHAELSTTEIYTHVSIRMLKQVHTATHPAAKLDHEHTQSTVETTDRSTGGTLRRARRRSHRGGRLTIYKSRISCRTRKFTRRPEQSS